MNSSGSDLSKTLQPISIARGLPNEHYVDHSVFEEEKKAVLFDNSVTNLKLTASTLSFILRLNIFDLDFEDKR